jgi:hypothetical protein
MQVLMDTPDSRAEFERNLSILREKIKDGKFVFAHRNQFAIDGLLRVRYLPNGRADLLSIDEGTRLTANTCARMDGQADALKSAEPDS